MINDTLQRPFRDLRISVTDRCNFRCSYCMPAEIYGERYEFLSRKDLLTFEEITRLTSIFTGLGAGKVRITGGEPLVRNEIELLIKSLSEINEITDLTLTTNAYLLPQKADTLKKAGLQRVTISLDSLEDSIFKQMNGRGFGIERVLQGIKAAECAGLTPIKINCVVQKGVNDHTLVDLARFFKNSGHIVRFIEYMDVGNRNGWELDQVVPAEEIISMINASMPLDQIPNSYPGEVASRYIYRDGSGEIGVIASVTKPFCGDCTRLRLSPEGIIYTCLFASNGKDLREPLRSGATDTELRDLITGSWKTRNDQYSEERSIMTKNRKKVEMYHIGG